MALGSLECVWLSRPPRMKHKYLLGGPIAPMDPLSAYFLRAIKETDDPLVHAVAEEREPIRGSHRLPVTAHVPPVKDSCPPRVMREEFAALWELRALCLVLRRMPPAQKRQQCAFLTRRMSS